MASLRNSVKYDVFAGLQQIATLVTNNKKTFARTRDNLQLSLKSRSNWFSKRYYHLRDESGNPVATILYTKPIFGKAEYKITFDKTNSTFQLSLRTRKESKEVNANFIYDLLWNSEPVCTIINYRKPPFFYIPTEVQLEGTIHFSDDIQMIEILCFLQLINIHIDNEFNAS